MQSWFFFDSFSDSILSQSIFFPSFALSNLCCNIRHRISLSQRPKNCIRKKSKMSSRFFPSPLGRTTTRSALLHFYIRHLLHIERAERSKSTEKNSSSYKQNYYTIYEQQHTKKKNLRTKHIFSFYPKNPSLIHSSFCWEKHAVATTFEKKKSFKKLEKRRPEKIHNFRWWIFRDFKDFPSARKVRKLFGFFFWAKLKSARESGFGEKESDKSVENFSWKYKKSAWAAVFRRLIQHSRFDSFFKVFNSVIVMVPL